MGVKKEAVVTAKAWKTPGRKYSQALRVSGGTLVFVTGQTPRHPMSGQFVEGDIEGQARQVVENLKGVLTAAGCGLDDVVQLRIYYKELQYVAPLVKILDDYFTHEPFPVKTSIVCNLSNPAFLVEIDAIAAI